jgi:hypothetical protein
MPQPRPERPEPAEEFYQRIMDLHFEAFAAERFEAAHHVLAAALHVAEEMSSTERLSDIQRLSEERQAEIDRIQPVHAISTTSSATRGSIARFTSLAGTARATSGRINATRALQRVREGPLPWDPAHES